MEKPTGIELLEHVLKVSKKMAETRELNLLLNDVIDEALKLVGGERGYVVLLTDAGELDFKVMRLSDGSDIPEGVDMISRSILDEVIKTEQSIVLTNAMTDQRFATAHSVMAMRLRSVMCVPLIVKNHVIGAIYVENRAVRARFRAEDVPPLELFGNQAAVAIDNATLYEELEERVRARTKQLEAANKELEAFSYSISHDLRAPLRAVQGFTQIVMDDFSDALPERAKRFQMLVVENSRKMEQLIDDLLAFSRSGRSKMAKREVDVNILLGDVLTEQAFEREMRPVELNIQDDMPPCLADPRLLRRVYANLLGNAFKFTRGRDPAIIDVGAKENESGETVYFVKDNGAGFDMRFVKRLFGVFQRLHSEEAFEGTGVGLATVRRIINRHGGQIWAEAEPDKGAAFFFTLSDDLNEIDL